MNLQEAREVLARVRSDLAEAKEAGDVALTYYGYVKYEDVEALLAAGDALAGEVEEKSKRVDELKGTLRRFVRATTEDDWDEGYVRLYVDPAHYWEGVKRFALSRGERKEGEG